MGPVNDIQKVYNDLLEFQLGEALITLERFKNTGNEDILKARKVLNEKADRDTALGYIDSALRFRQMYRIRYYS